MGRLKACWAESILPFQNCSWRCVSHQQLPQGCQIQSRPTSSQCGVDLQCQNPWEVCVGPGFAATAIEDIHGRETGHVRLLQYPNFGACKIQLFQRSPAQRVLLAWQALDLEVQGKLNPLHGRGGCLFLVSSPLLTASLKPEQSCALTWFLLSSASIYPAKKSFCCLWEPNPQEEPVTVTTPCPALAQSSPLRPGSVSSTTTVICRVGFFPLLFLIRG